MIQLQRAKENPILRPTTNSWENLSVFNPGAIIHNNEVHLLYRGMSNEGPLSHLGHAISKDGIHFQRFDEPVYKGGRAEHEEAVGVEDTRIVKIDDLYYIIYTLAIPSKEGKVNWGENIPLVPHIALATTKNFRYFAKFGTIIKNLHGKDASLFPKKVNGKYWVLFRTGIDQTFFSMSDDLYTWSDRHIVFDKREGYWDNNRVGIGAPPIETEKGWLLFYHGVDNNKIYRLGVIFLDLKYPAKILYRSPEPIFEPQEDYEKKGHIDNVVFTCGVVEKDNRYYVYYGAADSTIGLATIEKEKILNLF